jgi:hypothetical protein
VMLSLSYGCGLRAGEDRAHYLLVIFPVAG